MLLEDGQIHEKKVSWVEAQIRRSEVESLTQLFGEGEVSLEWKIPEYYHPDLPFHFVNLPSEDVARNIANRSIVVKGTCELWGEGSTYEELEAVIKDYPNEH
ncbi:hypothetical protein GIB67_017416 [Kingdonia uniflora]|uniref:tRNA (guanine(10)-N(2))-methyltransferase TRMT11 N-terminal domain-containing protein n=1 Tax=Kingdonia uniflora TaxID=39325 RepID=A0A7J7M487_9MAGN|nr:hypothetical protein GIB67_017416 [Kingdonia uniflora]